MNKNIGYGLLISILSTLIFLPFLSFAHTPVIPKSPDLLKLASMNKSSKTLSPLKIGVLHVAIILTKKPSDTGFSITNTQINSGMTELNNFIKENSYNKASLVWDIYGPYNAVYAGNPYGQMIENNISMDKYDVIISIDDRIFEVCQSGGCALPPLEGQSGTVFVGSGSLTHMTNGDLYHEFGHALGFGHANLYTCNNGLTGQPCVGKEYGNIFSAMGGNIQGPYVSLDKETAGWVGSIDGSLKTIIQKGTYRLYPFENKQYPVVLKIPKELKSNNKCGEMDKNHDYYYLQFPTPYDGYDSNVIYNLSNFPLTPAYIPKHILGPQIVSFDSITNKTWPGTALINMKTIDIGGGYADSLIFTNNVITAENPFYDPITGIKITVPNVTNDYVDVNIEPGYKVCGTPNPPPSPYWTGSLLPTQARVGDTVSISWDYKNPPDDVQCRISNNVLGTTGWTPGPIQPKDSRRVLITTSTSTSSYSTATKREFRLECSNVGGVKSIYGTTLTIIPTPASTSTPPGPNNINCSVTLNTSRDYSTKTIVTGLTQCATQSSCMTPYPHTDACANTTILNKYYCAAGYVVVDQHACPYGCSNGICNSPTARAKNTKISLLASVIQVIEGVFNLK